jgi:myo-inositol-1(or 4)-monophosphatase
MDYLEFIQEQLLAAAEIAKNHFGKVTGSVKAGDNNQVLTDADLAIGKQIVNAVQGRYPDHNVIDEEAGGINKNSRFTWVIDPIEGTSNFAAGSPFYGIMIGLLEDATPIAGGIAAPALNQLYLAAKGQGATCNGEKLQTTSEQKLANVLLSYGIDGHPEIPGRTANECAVLADIADSVRNIRNAGCEAFDSMYVAKGHYGARLNTTSKIWDNVAPHIICEEAGAIWTDIKGAPMDYSQPLSRIDQNFTNCVASPALHQQLQTIINGRLS